MKVKFLRIITILSLLILLSFVVAIPATFAQSGTPDNASVESVSKELFCPLCKGVRLDNCDLTACSQMREVIAQKLAKGESPDQIKADFVQQYGDVVLGEPPLRGFNLLAWLLPAVILVGGAIWILMTARRWASRPSPATTGPALEPIPDEYAKRIEKELEQSE